MITVKYGGRAWEFDYVIKVPSKFYRSWLNFFHLWSLMCHFYNIDFIMGTVLREGGGPGSESFGTRFWDNKLPKRTTTWANFLVHFPAKKDPKNLHRSNNGCVMAKKRIPIFGIIGIFKDFLVYNLARYQYFLMRQSLFD